VTPLISKASWVFESVLIHGVSHRFPTLELFLVIFFGHYKNEKAKDMGTTKGLVSPVVYKHNCEFEFNCICVSGVRERIRMDRDRVNANGLQRPVLVVDRDSLESIQCVESVNQLPKDRVLAVQMRLLGVDDVELGEVGVGAFVGHGQNAPGIVLEGGRDLVLERRSPDRLSGLLALGVSRARLDHEALDVPVEGIVVVEPRPAEGQEVLARLGCRCDSSGPSELHFTGSLCRVGDGKKTHLSRRAPP
jgi:hypothetical protein